MLYIRNNVKTLKQLLKWYEDEMFLINKVPDENLEIINLINIYFPLNLILSMNKKNQKNVEFKIEYNEKFLITLIYFMNGHLKIEGKYFNEFPRPFQRKIEEKEIEVTTIEHENESEDVEKTIKQYLNLN